MFKALSKLSFPIVIGQLSFAFMSFIDTILMGQLGVLELAGGGLGAVVYQFFYVVGIGALAATANLIAFSKGKADHKSVHKSLLAGVVVVLVIFVLFAGIILNAGPFLTLLGQDVQAIAFAVDYLDVVVWSLLPAFGFVLMRSLVLGLGRPGSILPISVLATLLNYPLSYVLMTGQFGLPAMGVAGIALGTTIIACAMLLGLVYLTYRQAYFKQLKFWKGWREFSPAHLKETVRLGFPIALAHAMEVGMFSGAALIVGLLGVNALAAHQVALQCTTLSFMIPLGIAQAVSVKVGEMYGKEQIRQAREALFAGLMLASCSALIAGLVFLLYPEYLVHFFLQGDQINPTNLADLMAVATAILFIAALFQFVDAWQVVIMGALRGFKLGSSPTLIAIFCYWLVGMPAAYFGSQYYGAAGVWMGMGVGLGLCSVLLAVLFWYHYKLARSQFSDGLQ